MRAYTMLMYPTPCPGCGQELTNSEDKTSITLVGLCLVCVEEEAAWESEGGAPCPIRTDDLLITKQLL